VTRTVRFLTVISWNFKRRLLVNHTSIVNDDYHFAFLTSRSIPQRAILVGVSSIQLARPSRDTCGSSWNLPFHVLVVVGRVSESSV